MIYRISTITDLREWLEGKTTEHQRLLEKMDADRERDQLAYWLSWNALTLLGTARHDHLARQLIVWVDARESPETERTEADFLAAVRREAEQHVLHRDHRIESRSTLASANYDEDYERQFWTQLLALTVPD